MLLYLSEYEDTVEHSTDIRHITFYPAMAKLTRNIMFFIQKKFYGISNSTVSGIIRKLPSKSDKKV